MLSVELMPFRLFPDPFILGPFSMTAHAEATESEGIDFALRIRYRPRGWAPAKQTFHLMTNNLVCQFTILRQSKENCCAPLPGEYRHVTVLKFTLEIFYFINTLITTQ